MNKILKRIVVFVAFAVLFSISRIVYAEIYTGNCGTGVDWKLNTETGVFNITGNGDMGDFMFGNYPTWQNHKTSIKSIVVDNGVKSIGQLAFEQCENLETVTLGSSVEEIRQGAFNACPKLWGIVIPKSVKRIHNKVTWMGCKNLTHIYVHSIAAWCEIDFDGGQYLTGNPLEQPLAELYDILGNKITHLKIPDGVTEIKPYTFINFKGTSVTIPPSVTKMAGAFDSSNVEDVYISDLAVWCKKTGCVGSNLYLNDELITDLVVPDGVTEIAASAFAGLDCIESITIPDSVTRIGECAFANLENLKKVTFGNNVASIEKKTFSGCTALTEIVLSESVINIGDEAFSGCNSLKELIIPNLVTSIGKNIFLNCTNLEKVVVGNGIKELGTGFFSGCTSLAYVTIGSGVNTINKDAFADCTNLKVVSLADIGSWCKLNFEKAAYSPFYNGAELYYNNEKITKLIIPEGVETIGNYCFYNCDSITEIVLPNSLKSYGDSTFASCDNVERFVFGDGIDTIKDSEFYKNTKLKSVVLGNNIKTISSKAFYGCTGLMQINIPDSVTCIGASAFHGCTGLTTVNLGNGLENIGEYAFAGCSRLLSLTYPTRSLNIGQYAFNGCGSLSYIYISDITAWCESFFSNSYSSPANGGASLYFNGSKLTELVVPEGTTKIGAYAFYENNDIMKVLLPHSIETIKEYAFYSSLIEEINIPNSVKSIGSDAFKYCNDLKNVNIDSIESWVNIDFYNAGSNPLSYKTRRMFLDGELLEQVVVPDGTTTLSLYCFYNASFIKSIVIPTSLTSIFPKVFYGCSKIETIYYKGTEQQWNEFDIGEDNGSLASAMVYPNYIANSVKVEFVANADKDSVSNLPVKTSATEEFVLPNVVPERAGFSFVGWALSADETNVECIYSPGETIAVFEDVCFYAIWSDSAKYEIGKIIIKNISFEVIENIPNAPFNVIVDFTNIAFAKLAFYMICTYDENGILVTTDFMYANPDVGSTMTVGTQISNSEGKVAKIKAFVFDAQNPMMPLAEAVEWE